MSRYHAAIKNDRRWHAARAVVLERDDWCCTECEATDDLTVDHTTPLAVLFADGITPEAIALAVDPDHLVTLCRPCNSRKSDQIEATTYTRHTWISPYWTAVLGPILDPLHQPTEEVTPVL